MARFGQRDTKPELLVRREIHKRGFRFRLHRRDLPGRPDIVLPRLRLAIFVHGCFWHQHEGCKEARIPKTNPSFWEEKFERNRQRDALAIRTLTELEWKTLVIWECQAKSGDFVELLDAVGLLRKRCETDGERSAAI